MIAARSINLGDLTMARSDLIISLVRAASSGDKAMLRSTVEALAAEERAKNHGILADRLTRALQANGHHMQAAPGNPTSSSAKDFVAETIAQRTLDELVLSPTVRKNVNNLIEEQYRTDLLRSHGIHPRHRILLSGPPGNGKTALAEAIAEALAVPFFTVRYDALIGSYLGETTQRLRLLFDYIRTIPCVLFFDEFDAVGKERGDLHETGEIKRVVSSLLLQIDALPSYVVVTTATNHAELLDRAVWRRFQLRLAMPSPAPAELVEFFDRAFRKFPEPVALKPVDIVEKLGALSYAEATEFCIDLRRRHILCLGEKRFSDIARELLPLWSARAKVAQDANQSQQATAEVQRSRARPASKGKNTAPTLSTEIPARAPRKKART